VFKLKKLQGDYLIYDIKNEKEGSWITIIPERGGIITSLGIDNKEILYLDEKSLKNEESIRGGVPILFPICGRLTEAKYELKGNIYQMQIHGFARILNWEVIDLKLSEKMEMKLRTSSDGNTKKIYPFDFELIFTYILDGNKLTIKQEYINKSEEVMPIYTGFHPYFKVGDKEKLQYQLDCTKYLNDSDMSISDYNGRLDMSGEPGSKILLDMNSTKLSFFDPDLGREIKMEYGENFKYIVVWTLQGKDFLCVEPWMALPDAFNTKEGLEYIEPGKTLKESVSFTVDLK